MKCERVNNFNLNRYKLADETLRLISKTTKLSKEELTNLPLDKQIELMEQRGSIKKPSPVRNFISDLYRKVGEKFGLLEKNRNYNFYTDID